MQSLFVKIFLWFWLAMLVVGGTLFLAQRHWADSPLPAATAMRAYGAEAGRLLEQGDEQALQAWLAELGETGRTRFFLFGPQGQELSGRELSPEFTRFLYHRQAQQQQERRERRRFAVQAIEASEGEHRLVALRPPGSHLRELPTSLRLAIAMAITALVSLLLSAHLTRPIRRVRQAAQRLAAGDLHARVAARDRGGDEIAHLGRDFNAMAERVQSLIQAQGRLLRDVSHELRSPLARLQVALELARGRAGAQAEGALSRIELEAERLNDLIGQVLTLERMETGALNPRQQRVDLSELLEEVVADADFEADMSRRHVQLCRHAPATVDGDPALLRSALENVVRNAIRYTPEGSSVDVELLEQRGAFVIKVHDHGPGVPEEQLEQIFEPFVRVSGARERESGGYGLGLAIARRGWALHGGEMTAANREGGGMTVTLTLPV